jgi:hypothetical protein
MARQILSISLSNAAYPSTVPADGLSDGRLNMGTIDEREEGSGLMNGLVALTVHFGGTVRTRPGIVASISSQPVRSDEIVIALESRRSLTGDSTTSPTEDSDV